MLVVFQSIKKYNEVYFVIINDNVSFLNNCIHISNCSQLILIKIFKKVLKYSYTQN